MSVKSTVPFVFTTESAGSGGQIDAWREWFNPVFDISCVDNVTAPFCAENKVWDIGGIVLSRASAPATRVKRDRLNISRAPVDHWVITYNLRGQTNIVTDKGTLRASTGVPFVWSLGDRSSSERSAIERIQLLIPRDKFREIAPMLDAARGAALSGPLSRMFGDYLIFLEDRLDALAADDIPRLTEAVRSMIAACIAPSIERAKVAADEIDYSRRERICRFIQANLQSPALSPATICKAVGISRSHLYRLFEGSGGVLRYIQRQRLELGHAMLSDHEHVRSILSVAQHVCFEDASSFSRAFRREFGHSPSDVKSAAQAGIRFSVAKPDPASSPARRFADLLAPVGYGPSRALS